MIGSVLETSTDESMVLELVNNFCIPVQEDILSELISVFNQAKADEEIDYLHVEHLITNDVSLSASIMQIANSSSFKEAQNIDADFTSLNDAIHNLGFDRLKQLLNSINLQDKFHVDDSAGHSLLRFWDSAVDVAVIGSYLAQQLKIDLSSEAYEAGLFRDCGIPVMLQGIPTYKSFLKEANHQSKLELKNLEQEAFRFDHHLVGYHLAKKWNLPDIICEVIKDYHIIADPEAIQRGDSEALNKNTLICLVEVAEDISDRFRAMDRAQYERIQWPMPSPFTTHYLGVSVEELFDIMEDTLEKTEQLLTEHEH